MMYVDISSQLFSCFFPPIGHSHSEDEEENEFEDAVEELAENFIVHVNPSQAHKRSSSNVSQVRRNIFS